MSFVAEYHRLPLAGLIRHARTASASDVRRALTRRDASLLEFAALLSPSAAVCLPDLACRSRELTLRRFGRVIRLFAPLYLSNECINNCRYCGFSRDNPILRVTLSVDDVAREARALLGQGFRHLLLVAGEHPRFVSNGYLADCLRVLHAEVPSLSLEVGPMETSEYVPLAAAGAEGLVVYQETYDPAVYETMHTAGPKRNFAWRMETPERAYAAGFRRLGIGALYGLADWRHEAICVAAHAAYLLRHCWKSQITISVPRLRPCAGEFEPLTHISDRELVQLVCAFRIFLPDVGLVLSTREPAHLRNGLIPLGITLMSAGSHTAPGGYTGAGSGRTHLTQRGRIVQVPASANGWGGGNDSPTNASGQFEIADGRSASEVSRFIAALGYEPVWKDWDTVLTSGPATANLANS